MRRRASVSVVAERDALADHRPVGLDLLGYAPEWHERALCRETDPEAFFPEKGGDRTPRQSWAAKRICRRCPVRAECLRYALETNERHGIWGGLTERERRSLKRRAAA